MDKMKAAESVRKVAMLTRGVKVAMVTAVAQDGSLHSRPMAAPQAEFDGVLWFFTRASAEVRDDAEVVAAFASPDDHRYVSLSGRGSIVRDPETLRERWSPIHRMWFPQGLDDPDLVLLRVDVRVAQYWDMLVGGMVVLPVMETAAMEMAVGA